MPRWQITASDYISVNRLDLVPVYPIRELMDMKSLAALARVK